MINIVHILEDYSFLSGGLRTTVKNLHNKLINHGFSSKIVTTRKEQNDDVYLVKGGKTPWRFSTNLKNILRQIHKEESISVIHIHGVWMYPQFLSSKFAFENKIPFLISCHGMYEPWLWKKGKFKKHTYFTNVVKKPFSKANCIHAITEGEAKELKKLFPRTRIELIPNLIENNIIETSKIILPEKYILFLGRIDEKKGIDLLIEAFAQIKNNNFKLKIAGSFNKYKLVLDALVKQYKLEDKIEFLGLVVKEEKEKLFKEAFAFIAPSHSEVVGMVNLEAAILGTPVVTTFQTGLDKNWANNGGVLINPTVKEIQTALQKVFSWSIEERYQKGNALKQYVQENYSWQHRFKDWIKLYENIL